MSIGNDYFSIECIPPRIELLFIYLYFIYLYNLPLPINKLALHKSDRIYFDTNY